MSASPASVSVNRVTGSRSLTGLVLPIVVVAVWEGAARMGWVNAYLAPAPSRIVETLFDLASRGQITRHVLASLHRIGWGFSAAVVLALPLALVFRLFPRFEPWMAAALDFMRAIPPLALVPLLILWFGIGETPKVAIIVLASFFPILLNAQSGLAAADEKLVEAGRSLDLNTGEMIRFILLPAALPFVFAGIRLAIGNCWRALIGAELIATSVGLGFLVLDAQMMARTDIVYAAILVIGALGLASDRVLLAIAERMAPSRAVAGVVAGD